MSATRREFIKSLGIALALLLMTRCGSGGKPPSDAAGASESLTASANELVPDAAALARERLLACWLGLDVLAQAAPNYEQVKDTLVADHRAALDDLVAAGVVDQGVSLLKISRRLLCPLTVVNL